MAELYFPASLNRASTNLSVAALFFLAMPAFSQTPPSQHRQCVLSTQSNLVVVPTMVTTQTGATVFSLSAQDFTLTDNGVTQKVNVDGDVSPSPLSIMIVLEIGGFGTKEMPYLKGLTTMLNAMVGEHPHEVALVAFDSHPHLVQDFTPDVAAIGKAVGQLWPGDRGAAILDGLEYSVKLLQKRPATNRRVVLLISETLDHGSQADSDEVLQELSSTNIPVYSVAFSTTKAQVHDTLTTESPGMAKKAQCIRTNLTDPDSCYTRGYGALGRALVLASRLGRDDEGSDSNVAQVASSVTGGKYLPFDATAGRKDLEAALYKIANDLPNRYILSFRPASPSPGLHNLEVGINGHPDLQISARTSYWITEETTKGPLP